MNRGIGTLGNGGTGIGSTSLAHLGSRGRIVVPSSKLCVTLLDDNAKTPSKKVGESGYALYAHSFKKAWVRTGHKEDVILADDRGLIPGITNNEVVASEEDKTPKEIRDSLKPSSVVINPGERILVGTGIECFVDRAEKDKDVDIELQLRTSDTMAEDGLIVLDAPATIDPGFRGEICVYLSNSSMFRSQTITIGEPIALMVPAVVPRLLVEVLESRD